VLPGTGAEEQAEAPLQALDAALSNAPWPAGEVLPQAVQDVQAAQVAQAALAAPLVQGQSLAPILTTLPMGMDAKGIKPSLDRPVGKDLAGEAAARSAWVTPGLQAESSARAGAAEVAANGQLLPSGREKPDLQVQVPRGEAANHLSASNALPFSVSMTVAQNLAAQVQSTAPGVMEGVSVQVLFPGVASGMSVMGDLQGRPTSGTMHMAIDVPVRSPMFSQELGERIVWLSLRQGQVADIALNPPHLGPLEVKLSLVGGEAGAQFFSPHPQVRDAIEAALPRLRELMAEAGVTLGQTQVREESFSRQESVAHGHGRHEANENEDVATGSMVAGLEARHGGLGLVDIFV
jgi:flagellar hook-length control protein FliK